MAFGPPIHINTTFIGDNIFMEFLKLGLHKPVKIMDTKDTHGNAVHRCRVDFAIEGQTIAEVKNNIQILIKNNNKIHERVILMIGTYDILKYTHGGGTSQHMVTDLFQLIQDLWRLKVQEIVLCTIPYIFKASVAQYGTLEYYNYYIRNCDGIQVDNQTVRVVDLYETLSHDVMFQSDGLLPNEIGVWKMQMTLESFM